MDKKAIYNLSYGVFMVSTKAGEVANGCITNTCIQVASNPVRIAISVLNSNYTCDLIKESGIFAVSILDNDCTFETIKLLVFSQEEMWTSLETLHHLQIVMMYHILAGNPAQLLVEKLLSNMILEHTHYLLQKLLMQRY